MFIENKYTRWYTKIINTARVRGTPVEYYEKHHVIPKCLGGSNTTSNLVRLTAREHYVAHLLLVKMTTGTHQYSMICALARMSKHATTATTFALIRQMCSRYSTGARNPAYGKMWIHDPNTGKALFIHKSEWPQYSTTYHSGLLSQRGGHTGTKWITNGTLELMITDTDRPPTGWRVGRCFQPSHVQLRNAAQHRHTKSRDADHSTNLKGRITMFHHDTQSYKRFPPDTVPAAQAAGWVIRSRPTSLSRPVMIDGVIYHTMGDAAQHYGISVPTLSYRVTSPAPRWTSWQFTTTDPSSPP
jgi:hypothetical protein